MVLSSLYTKVRFEEGTYEAIVRDESKSLLLGPSVDCREVLGDTT